MSASVNVTLLVLCSGQRFFSKDLEVKHMNKNEELSMPTAKGRVE